MSWCRGMKYLQEFDIQEVPTEKDKKVDRKSCLGFEGSVGHTHCSALFSLDMAILPSADSISPFWI